MVSEKMDFTNVRADDGRPQKQALKITFLALLDCVSRATNVIFKVFIGRPPLLPRPQHSFFLTTQQRFLSGFHSLYRSGGRLQKKV